MIEAVLLEWTDDRVLDDSQRIVGRSANGSAGTCLGRKFLQELLIAK